MGDTTPDIMVDGSFSLSNGAATMTEGIVVPAGIAPKKPVPEVRDSEVIYQIYPASFKDSGETVREGEYKKYKGWGDLKGIKEKLHYVKDLGVDAIWISPFFLSPEGKDGDGGYAISNYREIDPRFGDEKDFRDLLKEAHDLGLKVYTDFVLCHTSHKHEWFEASSDPGHPDYDKYRDYYVWHDGKRNADGQLVNEFDEPVIKNAQGQYIRERLDPGEIEVPSRPHIPNNWRSVFNGPAWSWNDKRQQYYLHHFNTTQPALNFSLTEKEKKSTDIPDEEKSRVLNDSLEEMKFWLDMGVDGLRIDALPYAFANANFKSNPGLPNKEGNVNDDVPGPDAWNWQTFRYSMCHPDVETRILPAIRKLANKYKKDKTATTEAVPAKRIVVEAIAGKEGGEKDVEQAAEYIDQERGADCAYTNAFVSLFYPNDVDPGGYPTSYRLKKTLMRIMEGSLDGGYCHNLSNHDFPRYAGRMGHNFPEAYKATAEKQLLMLVNALPGSLCLYNGDELGLPEATPEDINPRNSDGELKNPPFKKRDLLDGDKNRDGCRTPMPWHAWKKNMDFTDHDDPYLPLAASHKARAVDIQKTQWNSPLKTTQRILEQRKNNPALNHGRGTLLSTLDPIVAFVRETDDVKGADGSVIEKGQAVLCAFNISGITGQYFVPAKVPGLKDNPALLRKLGLDHTSKPGFDPGKPEDLMDKVYIPPYGSTFIGLRQERDKNVEIGMETLRMNDPAIALELPPPPAWQMPKIFAADLLITDIHMSGETAEAALRNVIEGKDNQQRIRDNKPEIRWYDKSTITKNEYDILLAASQAGDSITAGGSTSCTLGTVKKLLKNVIIDIMGFAPDHGFGRTIKRFLDKAGITIPDFWPEEMGEDTAVSFIIKHDKGEHKGEHTILTYPGKQKAAFDAYQAEANKQIYEASKQANNDAIPRTAFTVEEKIKNSTIVYMPDSTLSKYGEHDTRDIFKWRWAYQKQLVLALPTHADFGPHDPEFFKDWIPSCNVVMGNDVEFYRIYLGNDKITRDMISDDDMRRITHELQDAFDRNELERAGMPCPKEQVAFITRGDKPALVVTKRKEPGIDTPLEEMKVPVVPIKSDMIKSKLGDDNAADAGFLAGYISGLDHMQSAEEGMRRANEKLKQEKPEPYIINPAKSWTLTLPDYLNLGMSPDTASFTSAHL